MASKKAEKEIKKFVKNLPTTTKVLAVVLFLISALGTYGAATILQKNDKFELIGEKIVTMNVGGDYSEPTLEEAIECVSFGRDVINTVSINLEETTYNETTSPLQEGTYYIVYQTTDFKYSSITRIRTSVVNSIEVNEVGIGE